MTTLRDECARRGLKVERKDAWSPHTWVYDCYDAMVHALGPYGDYEVVEGELLRVNDNIVVERHLGRCVERLHVGYLGDHVKLLVPPQVVAERDQLRKEPEGDSLPVASGAEQQQDDTEVEAVSLAVQAYVRTMMRERDQRIAELEETLELCLYELQDGRGYADEACDRVEDIVNAALRREAE